MPQHVTITREIQSTKLSEIEITSFAAKNRVAPPSKAHIRQASIRRLPYSFYELPERGAFARFTTRRHFPGETFLDILYSSTLQRHCTS